MSILLFKQKTADELRISDWSSDVCSSDLSRKYSERAVVPGGHGSHASGALAHRRRCGAFSPWSAATSARGNAPAPVPGRCPATCGPGPAVRGWPARSEEHTSELQSLMRISYAVFCLKKKNKTT